MNLACFYKRTSQPWLHFLISQRIIKCWPLCLLCLFLWSGNTSANGQYSFKKLNVAEGLPGRNVFCLAKDSLGFIWLGTQDGLVQYDGYQLQVFYNQLSDTDLTGVNTINNISYDNRGYLWLATNGGLQLFSLRLQQYVPIKFNDINKNLQKRVVDVVIDKANNLWVSADNKLLYVMLNGPSVEQVHALNNIDFFKEKDYSILFSALYCDTHGNIWVGTNREFIVVSGVNQSDITKFKFSSFLIPQRNRAKTFLQYNDSTMFMGTYNLLHRIIYKQNNEKHIEVDTIINHDFKKLLNNKKTAFNNNDAVNTINDLALSNTNNLWIATINGLLQVSNLHKANDIKVHRHKHNIQNETSIGSNAVYSVLVSGDYIFAGLESAGLNYTNTKQTPYKLFRPQSRTEQFFISDQYSALTINKNILFAIDKNGWLIYIDIKNDKILKSINLNDIAKISGLNVNKAIADKNGNVWIASRQGLLKFSTKTEKVIRYHRRATHPSLKLRDDVITTLAADKGNNIWFGIKDYGLHCLQYNSPYYEQHSVYATYQSDTTVEANNIHFILSDTLTNTLYLGTSQGVVRLLLNNNYNISKTEQFKIHEGPGSLISNNIQYIEKQNDSTIWVIHYRKGISKVIMQPKSNDPEKYTSENYLNIQGSGNYAPVNLFYAGNKLMVGGNSLFVYNPKSNQFCRIFEDIVPQPIGINRNAVCVDNSGNAYIGGVGGIMAFIPDSFSTPNQNTNVVITGVSVYDFENNDIYTESSKAKLAIAYSKKLSLKYFQNSLKFSFSSFPFGHAGSASYKYMLKGYDYRWNILNGANVTIYNHLPPGDYELFVYAGNSNGTWSNKLISLKINILPPFWKSPLAIIIYTITTLIVILMAFILQSRFLKLKNEIEIKKMQVIKDKEIHQERMRFFTNISHELRTPLSLIKGPVEAIENSGYNTDIIKQNVQYIKKSTTALLELVDEIMDFRKAESGKLNMYTQRTNVPGFVNEIVDLFNAEAKLRNIAIETVFQPGNLIANIDKSKLKKILSNLIYNALKFCERDNVIKIIVSDKYYPQNVFLKNSICIKDNERVLKNYFMLIVEDSGKGMEQYELNYIFERFYKGSNNNEPITGTGIGLALVKKLVLIHRGQIEVHSSAGIGTRFTIKLPYHIDGAKDGATPKAKHIPAAGTKENKKYFNKKTLTPESNTPVLLVIDDNMDICNFIKSNLSQKYRIAIANDGISGYEKAKEMVPDIIISDVMMPGMDGFELCNKLKNNIITSHIPVVLLTAKTSQQHTMEGIKHGADLYVNKPFSLGILEAQVNNLLKNRKLLQERFANQSSVHFENLVANSVDKNFINQINKLILAEISNSGLSVDFLASQLGFSRSAIFLKMKATTGYTPSDYIRKIRLDFAQSLLDNTDLTIAEVGFKSGFSNASYFSKRFKEQFKLSPSDYQAKKEK